MRARVLNLSFLVLLGAIMGLAGGLAWAAPPPPLTLYGTVLLDGANVPLNTVITAWCGTVQSGRTTQVFLNGSDGLTWYANLDVRGDDPDSTAKDGCTAGETVTFKIGAVPADQTLLWQSGSSQRLGLTGSQLGRLQVTKTVDWNGVPEEDDSFEICVSGPSHTIQSCKTITTAQVAAEETLLWEDLLPGDYVVTETAQYEWLTVVPEHPVSVPADGTTTTASVSNTRKLGSLEITKVVHWNDVSPVDGTTFNICISGPSYLEAPSCSPFVYASSLLQTKANLVPGDYTVTENPGSKWIVTLPSLVQVPKDGGTAKAQVTNEYKAGRLIVTKVVTNDNGGNKGCADFSFQVDGAAAIAFDASCSEELVLDAGTYSVTEPPAGGYTITYNDCASVVVPVGDTAICTITNDDQPGTLVVKKAVVNNNGGTLEADDFIFSVNGGTAVTFEIDGQNDLTVDAGMYSVTEPAVAGYTTTYDNCSDVVIANGGSATCTITNDDIAPSMTLVKSVTNDDGGSAAAGDWMLCATPSGGTGCATSFIVGVEYTLSESGGPGGYTSLGWSCVGASGFVAPDKVTLALAENVTCTITNDDQPGTLIVKKVVVNNDGGAKTAVDFAFSVDGGAAVSFEADGQNDLSLDADTYSVTELAVAGYTTTYDNCTGVVIPNGGTATCTITNDDQSATLIVKKVIVNGGDTPYTNFSFSVNGGTAQYFETDGRNDLTVDAGTYSVTEPAVAGYTTTYDNCTGVVLPNGGTATCTITNSRVLGSLQITKVVDWNSVTPVDGTTFTICIQGPSYLLGTETGACKTFTYPGELVQTWTGLIPGDYAVTETAIDGQPLVPATAPESDRLDARAEAAGQQGCTPAEPPGSGLFLASYRPAARLSAPTRAAAVSCKDFTYPDGLAQTWTNLVPGDYTIAGIDPGSKWIVTIDSSPASVPVDGGTGTATVTNTRLPDLPPKAPQVSIAALGIDANLTDARLTWPKVDTDESGVNPVAVVRYLVWRSESPYFVPDPEVHKPHGTVTTDLETPSFTDPGVVAGKDFNYYYMVQAVSDSDLASDFSNRTGEFTFGLTPGS